MGQPEENDDRQRSSEPERLWKVDDCAKYLNMSKRGVYRLVESGSIPFARIGNSMRFHPQRVREWAASQGSGSKVIPLHRGR